MASNRSAVHEREDAALVEALRLAVGALEGAEIPHLVFGGIAAVLYGRSHAVKDADVLVRGADADRALAVLERAGFETEVDNPNWLYKARRDEQIVDVIFQVKGGIHLDDEMLARGRRAEFEGVPITLVSPEDALLMESVSFGAETPRHWFNALAILSQQRLDWDIVQDRARLAPRRMLSLLVFAQGDLAVPDEVVKGLYQLVYEPEGP
ncbi:MAG TPA: nucleotidyltransferase [Actinomycetota bacterium]|nr:nucleotidyltransferase [Actinomycetota bacterium]